MLPESWLDDDPERSSDERSFRREGGFQQMWNLVCFDSATEVESLPEQA